MLQVVNNSVDLKIYRVPTGLRDEKGEGIGNGPADDDGGQADVGEQLNTRLVGLYAETGEELAKQPLLFFPEQAVALRGKTTKEQLLILDCHHRDSVFLPVAAGAEKLKYSLPPGE